MVALEHDATNEARTKDRVRSIAVLWVHKCVNLKIVHTDGATLTPTQQLLKRLSFARCEAELYARLHDCVDPGKLYTLLRYTLFGNVLCLGKPWDLSRIESLIGYTIIYQITKTLVWFATEAI